MTENVPPPLRGHRVFAAVNRGWARWEAGLSGWVREADNPFAQLGRAANLALVVAVFSGIGLLFWYQASVHLAHTSLAALPPGSLGAWMRALHRYASDLAMLLLVLHLGRTLAAGKCAGPRALSWASGVFLLGLVWFIGWTGFWLVWDQPARWVAEASLRFLDTLPLFGEPLGRLLLADRLVPSLLFFVVFFTHMLLPLLIAVGLGVHLSRLSRVRLLPDRPLTAWLLLGLALAALLVPAPLDAPARLRETPAALTVDAWYLSLLALTLRFQSDGVWWAVGLVGLFLFSLPWWLTRRPAARPASTPPPAAGSARPSLAHQAEVIPRRCHNCHQCVDDCPYDAVRMVPRTDGLPHPLQAWVDPERCVGCGVCIGSCDSFAMNLVRLDTRAFEQALVAQVGESARAGEPAWVALVAADAVSAPSHGLDRAPWGKLLPGFRIEPVPTASWVRTRLVENLLRAGAGGVLLVRDARAESAARDGNRWVEERLLGRREPPFNPARAGRSTWAVVDHDPARPGLLRAAAEAFRAQGEPPPVPSARPPLARGLATVLLHAAFLAAAILPSHLRVANPASPAPALVFTFRAFGERGEEAAPDPAEQAKLPVHMRGRSFAKPHRRDVQVRIEVDGQAEERAYRAKGVSRDGPVNAVWRMPLSPGPHAVRVELRASPTAEPSVWAGEILARPRVTEVLSYEPGSGFRREP